jgi:hypothetical protein
MKRCETNQIDNAVLVYVSVFYDSPRQVRNVVLFTQTTHRRGYDPREQSTKVGAQFRGDTLIRTDNVPAEIDHFTFPATNP